MEKHFELFISLSAGGIGTAIVAWIAMSVKVATLKTEIKYLQDEVKEEKKNTKEAYAQLNGKMDQVLTVVGEVKISLARIRPDHE